MNRKGRTVKRQVPVNAFESFVQIDLVLSQSQSESNAPQTRFDGSPLRRRDTSESSKVARAFDPVNRGAYERVTRAHGACARKRAYVRINPFHDRLASWRMRGANACARVTSDTGAAAEQTAVVYRPRRRKEAKQNRWQACFDGPARTGTEDVQKKKRTIVSIVRVRYCSPFRRVRWTYNGIHSVSADPEGAGISFGPNYVHGNTAS